MSAAPASAPASADAAARDRADPLAAFRQRFAIPRDAGGREKAYFCGNSLGLMPLETRAALAGELDAWATHAVEGHFRGPRSWMPYHLLARDGLARLAGAEPGEVVAMQSLTANLHLLMVSFFRPTPTRPLILIERGAFPSDRYAVESQLRFHGVDPAASLIELGPADGERNIGTDAVCEAVTRAGERLALVLWPGVQYRTGERFDLAAITAAAHRVGAIAGFDLAHAIGNVPVDLHDANADFAVWCSYKYLNAGPGAIGGAFVHARHAHGDRPRFAGWWGHDAASRFLMDDKFVPTPGADGWQLSNPPILALAPLVTSLTLFDAAGLPALRAKSKAMTDWLAGHISARHGGWISIATPTETHARGCQLSLMVAGGSDRGRALMAHLDAKGIVVDWREPDTLRSAPVPLYNSFDDCARLIAAFDDFRNLA